MARVKTAKVVQEIHEIEASPRDYVMARLAAGRSSAQAAVDAIDVAISHFAMPDDDQKGKERRECVSEALESLGAATRALECAEEVLDSADMTEGEPWDEADDDEDDDERGG